jgi:uncharacterized protein YqgV (UPF0045/DUF77 family)
VDVTGIAAQVSLYPLHQASLSWAIEKALRILRKHGLEIEPGAMSTIITGNNETVFAALQETFSYVAAQGQVVMIVTFSNACPVPSQPKESVTYEAICGLGEI